MRDRHCIFENYEVYFTIDQYPHPGNGWDDTGEAAEWTITSILDSAGNECVQITALYARVDEYLCNKPEFFEYEDYDE